MKIYLSPSDQWANKTASGHSEAYHCTMIAQAAKRYLELNGHQVRVGDNSKQGTYSKRVKEANEWGADLYICIHTNAGGGGKAEGTVVLCYPGNSSNAYVQAIYRAVAGLTPSKDRGIIARGDLYEINSTKMLCVYIEVDFHDNPTVEKWMDSHIDEIGKSIALGVANAQGKTFVSGKTETAVEAKAKQVPGVAANNEGLYYRAHCQTIGECAEVHDGQTAGTVGFGKRLEAFKINVSKIRESYPDVIIYAKAHIQGKGWVIYKNITDDTWIGTRGESLRLEAFELEVIGLPKNKKLMYRPQLQTYGWTGWTESGFTVGTVGIKKAIEAIQLTIVDK